MSAMVEEDDFAVTVAQVIRTVKRRHLRHVLNPSSGDVTVAQRQKKLAEEDRIASQAIGELQSGLAKLFTDPVKFNGLCELPAVQQ